jgi:AhpD family alkylhydroperoxidase
MSTLRLPYSTLSPAAYQGLLATKSALDHSSLGKPLIELVYLRVSQINGCAFCLEMHAKALRAGGMAQAKLDSLAGWRVSAQFDARERAALAGRNPWSMWPIPTHRTPTLHRCSHTSAIPRFPT